MYEAFYGFKERPFLTVPDPELIYWSEGHLKASTKLHFGIIARTPITMITGEIGTGKTTLIRRLLTESPEERTIGLVSNYLHGRGKLLHWIMMALEQPFDTNEDYVSLFKQFQEFVVAAYAAGRRVLLIFDEAQNLSAEGLEELRLITNMNAEIDELLQIIIVGQPQLRDLIGRPELAQFAQLIGSDIHLATLSASETAQYIQHRLTMVGAKEEIFLPRTCELIYEATGGVPRLVNILCDLCLACGFADEQKVIDEGLLREFLDSAKRHGIYSRFAVPRLVPTLVNPGS